MGRATLALMTVALLAACGEKKDAAKAPPPPPEVQVVKARSETVPVRREYVGNVTAYRSVQVRARVEGILEKRHYVEGSDVKPGQLLYTIDPLTYEAQLRDAEAALARAEAQLANARTKESRFAPLVKEEAVSRQDYDDAVTQMKSAAAEVNSARSTLDRAKLNVGYTRVVATEAGRIGMSQVPEGALVGKGEPTLLATIDKLDPIYVTFTIPDRDALAFRRALDSGEIKEAKGNTARFLLPDGTEYKQAGRIDFADTQINRETGTVTLRAVLPNGSPRLQPGMFIRVQLTAGERPNTVLIPQRAVMKVPNGHVAYVVNAQNKIERRDLVVGEWFKDDWVVEKGLIGGDTVVVDGLQRVQPGMTVRPAAYQPKPPGASAGSPAPAPASASAKK
ncbi:MAG: efflux RND transporter periplasmic adaptor subunit [Burkholderiaceae bacterium]